MNKVTLALLFIFAIFSAPVRAGNICGDNKLNKITICHAGSENNPHFVNICVDFSAVHGHLKNHSHDSVGECGSSAESLSDGIVYACNAGIKHEKPNSRVCYLRTNPAVSCNPSISCSPETSSCDCICSGTSDGPNNVDFMKYSGRIFADNEELENIGDENFWAGTSQAKTSIAIHNSGSIDGEGFVVATHTPENYVLRNNSLSFELGSELHGTEYFVDLCWKNINKDFAGKFEFTPKYSFKNKQLFGQTYVDSAEILTRTDIECTDEDDYIFNLFDEALSIFPSQMSELFPQVGSVDGVSFCRVRHYFKEDSKTFRPWNLNAIEVITSLEVKLTEDQVTPVDEGVKLCHPISAIPGNTNGSTNGNGNGNNDPSLQVCQVQFVTSLAYEQFVLDHEDSSNGNSNSSYSVNHNDDSRFTDSLNCGETTGLPVASPLACIEKFTADGYHSNHVFIPNGGTLIILEN
ncbi:hypothetical protein [Halobacteriovorax sp. JY17]|uniref:hypothetical protein n=1 Tax=Halobacteriovorax sp. JY17 TaxID=2014617 RepID=UPI000C5FA42C|nr:hypothetical protein [Halobacteriovorax sp. JY17]PIK16105.1 MAG: hypothetical protein CES88_05065 [Halobacteriovorax sp. JY17]